VVPDVYMMVAVSAADGGKWCIVDARPFSRTSEYGTSFTPVWVESNF
jgi:hypothetical protein